MCHAVFSPGCCKPGGMIKGHIQLTSHAHHSVKQGSGEHTYSRHASFAGNYVEAIRFVQCILHHLVHKNLKWVGGSSYSDGVLQWVQSGLTGLSLWNNKNNKLLLWNEMLDVCVLCNVYNSVFLSLAINIRGCLLLWWSCILGPFLALYQNPR